MSSFSVDALYCFLVVLELCLVWVTDKAVSLPSEEASETKAVLKIVVLPSLPLPCLALSFAVHCQYKIKALRVLVGTAALKRSNGEVAFGPVVQEEILLKEVS